MPPTPAHQQLRIGLLVCDHVQPELLPVAGTYQDMFATLFSGRPEIELYPYDLLSGEYPDDPSDCDGWISTGSKWSVSDDEPWIRWMAGFVSRLYEERRPHVGVADTEVAEEEEWMVHHRDSFQVVVSYQDQITKLPPDSQVLASTDHCPVSMFTMGEHFLGIGGHPEISIPHIRALIESRRAVRIPEATADAGLASLETLPGAALLRDWITEFLLGATDRTRKAAPNP